MSSGDDPPTESVVLHGPGWVRRAGGGKGLAGVMCRVRKGESRRRHDRRVGPVSLWSPGFLFEESLCPKFFFRRHDPSPNSISRSVSTVEK